MTTRRTPRTTDPDLPVRVRLRDPDGVVAAVPYLLGFTPRRSLVVIGVDDHQGVGPTLRCDLDPSAPAAPLREAWAGAVRTMRRNECSTALVVVYTDHEPTDLPRPVRDRLLREVLGPPGPPDGPDGPAGPVAADEPEDVEDLDVLDVLDVLVVGPSRFASLGCEDPVCCPSEGRPVADVGSHPVAAAFVLAGRSPAPDRDAVEPLASAPAAEREVALAAAARSRAAGSGADPGRDTGRTRRAGAGPDRRVLQEWLGCLPGGPDPELAGRLVAAWTEHPRLRDACMAAVLPAGEPAAVALVEGRPDAGALLDLALADPRSAVAVGEAAPVLRRLAALADGPDRATVLGAHAWLAWVAGDGTAAGILAERALAEDPSHSLAGLVLRCLDNGLGAPWTTRRRPAGLRLVRPDDGPAAA